jgi:hypothetical protein
MNVDEADLVLGAASVAEVEVEALVEDVDAVTLDAVVVAMAVALGGAACLLVEVMELRDSMDRVKRSCSECSLSFSLFCRTSHTNKGKFVRVDCVIGTTYSSSINIG